MERTDIIKASENYKVAKYACYITNISMSVVACLSPLLFVTFREMYGISYTLLGLLVVINFSTQLFIDLIFTFFAKRFNIDKTVRVMPFITFAGLLIYGIFPALFPEVAYLGLAIGTFVFSVSAGLNEVLASPLIAAIPSENPEREMSKLHSVYAWGVVGVVIISTVFLKIFGTHNWGYLALLWSLVPLSAFVMLRGEKLPEVSNLNDESKNAKGISAGVILCFGCIFLGGAAECTMTQWASGFIENAIGIPKLWGDILGVAVFAILLGLGRTMYAKCGKNIIDVMLFGMIGATVCYFVASLSLNPIIALLACIITGICVSMLWPGTIICVGEKIPSASVAVYALMAAGGDMGASVAPQLVGIISDKISLSDFAFKLSEVIHISAEQIGMRAGLLISAAFPLLGIVLVICLKMYFSTQMKNKCK